jgi:hypothetical protein
MTMFPLALFLSRTRNACTRKHMVSAHFDNARPGATNVYETFFVLRSGAELGAAENLHVPTRAGTANLTRAPAKRPSLLAIIVATVDGSCSPHLRRIDTS